MQFASLTYHVIGKENNQYTVGEPQFREHLTILTGEGFTVEGFQELESRLRSAAPWPQRYVVLTVDDGDRSSMLAAELLTKFGASATFFVTRDRCLHKPRYITEADIRQLRQNGFSVGTHGVTHRGLTLMPREQCVRELRESRRWLEDVLAEDVRYNALPGGFVNRQVLRLAVEEGYLLTATCKEWMNSPTSVKLPGEVNRVNIRRHFGADVFRRIIRGALPFFIWRQARAAALAVPKQILLR